MSIRSTVAKWAGQSSYWFLTNFTKGGSSFPGRITEIIDPHFLNTISSDYDVILVTGTNGKTMTTALIVKVLKERYPHILTNSSGSNMTQGIITSFLTDKHPHDEKKIAILEVDEANMAFVTTYIKPKAIVLTNIFRDQMDRYGEIYTTYQKILNGIELAPEATVIANGDAPIFNSREMVNPRVYYGFDDAPDGELLAHYNTDGILCPKCEHILHFKSLVYSNLGKYYCPHCGFKRPELDYAISKRTKLTPYDSDFEIDGHPFNIKIGGLYNIYNALTAYSVGKFFGLSTSEIQKGLAYDERVFGRQELIHLDDKKINLVLVKNPVGLDQVIEMITTDEDDYSIACFLNANKADGLDVSWIWDGKFEKFAALDIPAYVASGDRYADMAFRLQVAGIPEERIHTAANLEDALEEIKALPTKKVYILSTYTAMLQFRKLLGAKGYIKEGM